MKKPTQKEFKLPEHIKKTDTKKVNAYKQYEALHVSLQNHHKRWYPIPDSENPDKTIYIDLIQSYGNVARKTVHLTPEDQIRVKEVWVELQSIKTKMGHLRRVWDPPAKQSTILGLDQYHSEILELLGQWKTLKEVQKILYDRHAFTIQLPHLEKFSTSNRDKIDELRTKWKNSVEDLDVAHKRGRIERLAYLAKTQMDKYNDSGNYSINRSKEVRAILEQIRKEVEGDKIHLDINGNIDINATINMNMTIQKLTQKVSINALVVGLVASKRGLKAERLMACLAQSYYKSYNGFLQNGNIDFHDQTQYPSNLIQQYNWDEIESKHAKGQIEQFEEAEVVEEEKESSEDIRSKMLDLLGKKQTDLVRTRKK